jgi:hypothetical protein
MTKSDEKREYETRPVTPDRIERIWKSIVERTGETPPPDKPSKR